MLSIVSFSIPLLSLLLLISPSSQHLLRVKGNLKCGEFPAAAVTVKLFKNSEKTIIADTHCDKLGNFEMTADTIEQEYTPIIGVFHDCDDGVKAGQRKLKFQVPKYYIGSGNPFELGSFNLETRVKHNEERQRHVDRRRRHLKTSTPDVFNGRDEQPDSRQEPW